MITDSYSSVAEEETQRNLRVCVNLFFLVGSFPFSWQMNQSYRVQYTMRYNTTVRFCFITSVWGGPEGGSNPKKKERKKKRVWSQETGGITVNHKFKTGEITGASDV